MFALDETEVLVVGAGPVGLLTAVLLAREGIKVSIIDEQWRPAVHSYACALHPGSLALLDDLGLSANLIAQGRRIETVAFYDGKTRAAEVRLDRLTARFPFLLVVPQSLLEGVLEETLARQWGVRVHWNHRLRDLRMEPDGVRVNVDRLGGTAKGHIVPRWEWVVEKSIEGRVEFVVGADGHRSLVRESLGIESKQFGAPEMFAVYEYQCGVDPGHELRVVLDKTSTNVLWPLPGSRCRWSFQMATDPTAEFPAKERRPVRVCRESLDRVIKAQMERLVKERAPWFEGPLGELEWAIAVPFERSLVEHFGRERCWLVGDAAHQTGPVGMQSMNVGFVEAGKLAAKLQQILHENAPASVWSEYDSACRTQWELLMGQNGSLRPTPSAAPWMRHYAKRVLPCLPASGEELEALLSQIGVELSAASRE